MNKQPELLHTLRTLETALLEPDTRRDSARLDQLLDAEFEEIGRSGERYKKVDILRECDRSKPVSNAFGQDFRLTLVSDGVALLTYCLVHINAMGHFSGHTLRSSLWVQSGKDWKLRFHQGTPVQATTGQR